MSAPISKLPVPAGTSPFRVKGTSLLAIQQHAASVPGGLDAVVALFDDPKLAEFARQLFLPVAVYDALPILPFAEAIAHLKGATLAESVSARARVVAERDITVVQKLLFKLVSTETLLVDRLPKVALRYFDFGRTHARLVGPKRCELTMEALPAFLTPWFAAMLQGYVPFAMERAGARHPALRARDPREDGARGGLPTATLTCVATWS